MRMAAAMPKRRPQPGPYKVWLMGPSRWHCVGSARALKTAQNIVDRPKQSGRARIYRAATAREPAHSWSRVAGSWFADPRAVNPAEVG